MARGMHRMLWVAVASTMIAAGCGSMGEPEPAPASTASIPARSATPEGSSSGVEIVPVIVDYSPTVSDVGALLYLLSHPAVEVLAVTMPVTGEAGCELGLEVTSGILAMFEREDVPVACDPEVPDGARQWPAAFLAGHEALGSGLPAAESSTSDPRLAAELIADVAHEAGRPVVLYAVGPLTNVARALDRRPEVIDQLDQLVIMGGAVDAGGNVSGSDAEWNFWIDAAAAARVIDSGAPITLVPLDATDDVPVPGLWVQDLKRAAQSPAIQYLTAMVEAFPAVNSGFFYLWDELAASVAAGDGLVATEELALRVTEDGSVIRDPSGTIVRVATGVPDPGLFYAQFLTTLGGAPVDARAVVAFDERSIPTSIGVTSSPEEVLAYWMFNASKGDVGAAGSVVVPGAPWVGFGDSADAFAESAEPYDVSAIGLECTSDQGVATCDMRWEDVWISAIPDLDGASLRVQAEVVDGTIVAFQELAASADMLAALESHVAWLALERPDPTANPCSADPASRECSQLLVDTVDDWVASR